MSNVKNYTDEEILKRVSELATFRGFPDGVLDVWVRSNEDGYDQFDDKVYTFECYGDRKPPRFVMVCSGTTNAGSFGLMNFRTYNSKGCAVLKSDVIVYGSHLYGYHKNTIAYRQAKPFPYFRDGNRNKRAEEIGPEYNDIIYANCHAAGAFSTVIKNWSVACPVRNVCAQFDAWMKFMNKRPLSVAILKEF